MNLVAITTDNFVDEHLVRWLRYVSEYAPDAKKYLFYLGEGMDTKFPGLSEQFEKVVTLPFEDRAQFNRVRMSATTYFDIEDCVYCDIDCDILDDLSEIPALMGDKALGCVASPANHKDWNKMCADEGWDLTEYNNGLLYMSEDWGERYDWAVKAVEGKANPRIEGTISFNYMLKQTDDWVALPDSMGCIWWDSTSFPTAKVVQYCNDNGQRKRVMMEEEYRASRVPQVVADA
jgi:hypothetical protein